MASHQTTARVDQRIVRYVQLLRGSNPSARRQQPNTGRVPLAVVGDDDQDLGGVLISIATSAIGLAVQCPGHRHRWPPAIFLLLTPCLACSTPVLASLTKLPDASGARDGDRARHLPVCGGARRRAV